MTPGQYFTLKWLHIASACIGVGSNVTHFFWLLSANGDPVNRANILRLVKKIDDRLAVPAYAVATLCGITLWVSRWPTNTPWIVLSLILTTVLASMGIIYGPFMKRWIRLSAGQLTDSQEFANLARRLTIAWAGISMSVFAVLYMMIWKPALW